MTIEELKHEALQFDPSVRASLARDLLESLDDLTGTEIEQLWLEEAERRHHEMASRSGRDGVQRGGALQGAS